MSQAFLTLASIRPEAGSHLYHIKTPTKAGFFIWCHIADVFQTIDGENVDPYKLRELVKEFNLSDRLLAI